ncbi:YcxB family protein [Pseudoalteromonas sp. SSDWG2]|uniref:YcxB family protein n=1 Tax=Pseudoalteromonas sp. SSDWG2 TaxID=3139391 RepID=UPI003BAB0C77
MKYNTSYILNKEYFIESYEQSLPFSDRRKPKYGLVVFLAVLALFSIYQLQQHYVGYFLVALAVLEVVAFTYQKAWWVARQRLSRAAGNEVQLNVDEQGISTIFNGKKKLQSWSDIHDLIATDKGIIVVNNKGHRHYLSNSILNDEVIAFINTHKKQKPL